MPDLCQGSIIKMKPGLPLAGARHTGRGGGSMEGTGELVGRDLQCKSRSVIFIEQSLNYSTHTIKII